MHRNWEKECVWGEGDFKSHYICRSLQLNTTVDNTLCGKLPVIQVVTVIFTIQNLILNFPGRKSGILSLPLIVFKCFSFLIPHILIEYYEQTFQHRNGMITSESFQYIDFHKISINPTSKSVVKKHLCNLRYVTHKQCCIS